MLVHAESISSIEVPAGGLLRPGYGQPVFHGQSHIAGAASLRAVSYLVSGG